MKYTYTPSSVVLSVFSAVFLTCLLIVLFTPADNKGDVLYQEALDRHGDRLVGLGEGSNVYVLGSPNDAIIAYDMYDDPNADVIFIDCNAPEDFTLELVDADDPNTISWMIIDPNLFIVEDAIIHDGASLVVGDHLTPTFEISYEENKLILSDTLQNSVRRLFYATMKIYEPNEYLMSAEIEAPCPFGLGKEECKKAPLHEHW